MRLNIVMKVSSVGMNSQNESVAILFDLQLLMKSRDKIFLLYLHYTDFIQQGYQEQVFLTKQNKLFILKRQQFRNYQNLFITLNLKMMKIKINSCSSPSSQQILTPNNKSSDKCIRVSSKRKLLLSPSKDLIVFFGDSSFNKFNSVKVDQDKKKNTKLTLNRKDLNQKKNSQQKKQSAESIRVQKVLSISKSVQSLDNSKNLKAEKEERFLKLKSQVDQIRRKYSYNRISQQSLLQRINSSQKLGVSTQNTSNNSNHSLNNSKQKNSYLTPKNDRYLGKRILTKHVFAEQHCSKLRLSQSKVVKTIKMNTQQSQQMRRKKSYEISDLTSSAHFSSEITEIDPKMNFQFTFGSMALMDFQNKGIKPNVNKLKV